MDVSNALLIIGMFMPKVAAAAALFAAALAAALTGFSLVLSLWVTSVARSHDPNSWERATEKNRNT
jgi:hypothetical protein